MRHPYEKFIRLELITLVLVVIIGLISVFQGILIIMLFSLYLLSISIFFEALIAFNTHNTAEGAKQFVKAAMLMLVTTILLFHL